MSQVIDLTSDGLALNFIPHRPPWLLLDRVVSRDAQSVTVEKQLTVGEAWLAGDGLAETLLTDLLAQATACWLGTQMADGMAEGAGRIGYLVAVRDLRFHRRARAGETLIITASQIASMGALRAFRVRAAVGDEEIAQGELTCAID